MGTTNPNYTFIIDATPRQYTVNVSVTYKLSGKGSSTLTFSSVKPTTTFTVSRVGTQTVLEKADNTIGVALYPGIKIQATASATNSTPGRFMFMQIINTNNKQTSPTPGDDRSISNDKQVGNENFNGPLIDNGSDPGTIGYKVQSPESGGPLSWGLAPTASYPNPGATPPEMLDEPQFKVPTSYDKVAEQESFSTYLMYKPSQLPGAVWIALNQVDWSWASAAHKTGGTWVATAPESPQPQPTPKVPTGPAAFPVWVNTASNFNNQKLNPFT